MTVKVLTLAAADIFKGIAVIAEPENVAYNAGVVLDVKSNRYCVAHLAADI